MKRVIGYEKGFEKMKESDVSKLYELDWLAQNGLQSMFSDKHGCACVIKDDYGRYGAVSECTEKAYRDLASIVKPGRSVMVIGAESPADIPEWKKLAMIPGHGMVLESPIRAPDLEYEKLSQSDTAEMIELATASGLQVFPRNIELGDFYGVKKNGNLVAMAGEHAKIEGFTEVANVCTHSDFRGRGYSKSSGSVYYFFAREFNWDQKTVDSQKIGYLNILIESYKEEQRKEKRANLNRNR